MSIPLYVVQSCIFIFAAIKYLDYLLEYRAKNKSTIWIIGCFYLIVTTIYYFSGFFPPFNSVLFIAMIISFGGFFKNWKRILITTSFLVIALFISEVITIYAIQLISLSQQVNLSEEQALQWCNTITKLTIPLILYIFAKIFRLAFSKVIIPTKYLLGCTSIPFISVFIFIYIYNTNLDGNIPIIYSISASIAVMLMNFMIFLLFIRLTDYYDSKIANQQYIEQIDAFNNQQLNNLNSIATIRQIKHDLNNILLSVKISFERGNTKDALDAIEHHLYEANPVYFVSNTNIPAIDSIINYKNETARQMGIKIDVRSFNMEELDIKWTDVCVIMSIALDNAIEACNRMENSDERIIRITIDTQNQMLRVCISNPYNGIIRINKRGDYVSSKSDKENHGFGVSGIMRLLDKNNGFSQIDSKNNLFKLTFIIPEKQ